MALKSITFTFVSQFGANFEIQVPYSISRLSVDTNVPKRNRFPENQAFIVCFT